MTATQVLAILAVAILLAAPVWAQVTNSTPATSTESSPGPWSLFLNVSGYIVPHDRSYASPTFSADRGRVHFGARYNYEGEETGSLWVGYNFSAGHKVALEVTPMIGAVFGNTTGVAPGYQASLVWRQVELSTEGEYVFDANNSTSNFFYSWMELSYSPLEWCRVGLAAQRTKAYHTDLDIQRGLLIGVSHKGVDFTTYIFNAGWTDPTVVLSLGFRF